MPASMIFKKCGPEIVCNGKRNTVYDNLKRRNSEAWTADTVLPLLGDSWQVFPPGLQFPHNCSRRLDLMNCKRHLNENSSCKGRMYVYIHTVLLSNLFIFGTPTALYTCLNVPKHYIPFQLLGIRKWFPH